MDLTADPRRVYLQIAGELRQEIVSGGIAPGSKLPTARQLMERYGVASHTVQSALKALQNEDLTYSVHGKGTFVREDLDLELISAGSAEGAESDVITLLRELLAAVHDIQGRVGALSDEVARLRLDIDERD